MNGDDGHWAVRVEWQGENVLTIEKNCVSGQDLDERKERLVRMCARQLLAFVGEGLDEPERPAETP